MKDIYSYTICIVLLVLNISCSDILETEPESIITVESFWQSEEDAIGGLYGMYNQFRVFAGRDLILVGAARSDLMQDGLANADFRIKYFENTLNEINADLNWLQMYRVINYANLVIKFVPSIDFVDENKKNDILAQAYAMRAYMYFVMARTWGDVPLITDPIEGYDAETTFKPRTSVLEIFEFIKSDIDDALLLFSNDDFTENRSIWSRPATNMLKAEVYLWTGKTMSGGESDISIALSSLENAEVENIRLLDDFNAIFDYNNKGNDEIILAVNFTDKEASNNHFQHMYISAFNFGPTVEEQARAVIGTTGGGNYWQPSAQVRKQFLEEDKRKESSFVEIYTVNDSGQRSYYTSVVLKGKGIVDGGVRRFVDDIIIYRYADLLLMKAEAKNALGQDPTSEMNQIRQRAYGEHFDNFEFVNRSQTENDDAILQERLLELAFEGKRWWDLIRFDRAFDLVPSLQGKSDDKYLLLWPIPLSTLSLNSKLTQTPGY